MNDSGTAEAQLPEELQGWNWGAFLLGPIWAIGNRVWIGLAGFVILLLPTQLLLPGLLGFVAFSALLAAKGNEWAWKARHWESPEHFDAVQKSWLRWGVSIQAVVVAIVIVQLSTGSAGA
ncbi:MAG: ribonuclease G [Chloroflexota bacterium]